MTSAGTEGDRRKIGEFVGSLSSSWIVIIDHDRFGENNRPLTVTDYVCVSLIGSMN